MTGDDDEDDADEDAAVDATLVANRFLEDIF